MYPADHNNNFPTNVLVLLNYLKYNVMRVNSLISQLREEECLKE